jgi:hypothetical protein
MLCYAGAVFFALLAGAVLRAEPSAEQRRNLDALLTALCVVPVGAVAFLATRWSDGLFDEGTREAALRAVAHGVSRPLNFVRQATGMERAAETYGLGHHLSSGLSGRRGKHLSVETNGSNALWSPPVSPEVSIKRGSPMAGRAVTPEKGSGRLSGLSRARRLEAEP